MKRHRPLAGILFIIAALFISSTGGCGVVGRWVHAAVLFLIGRTGLGLVTAGLAVYGILLSGLGGLIGRWVVLGWRAWKRRSARRKGAIVVRPVPAVAPVPATPVPPAVDPEKLHEVRTGLKHLGYNTREVESAVARMDMSKGVETLLRDGITLLRRASA